MPATSLLASCTSSTNAPCPVRSTSPRANACCPSTIAGRRNLRNPWPTPLPPEVLGQRSDVLPALIREHLFVSLYRACAESLASENASRLAVMERADRNIDDLLEDWNNRFHQTRQGAIDEELFDVLSGFEALKHPR